MREFAKIEIGNGEIIKNMKLNSIQSPRTSYYKESAKARRWKKQQRIYASYSASLYPYIQAELRNTRTARGQDVAIGF